MQSALPAPNPYSTPLRRGSAASGLPSCSPNARRTPEADAPFRPRMRSVSDDAAARPAPRLWSSHAQDAPSFSSPSQPPGGRVGRLGGGGAGPSPPLKGSVPPGHARGLLSRPGGAVDAQPRRGPSGANPRGAGRPRPCNPLPDFIDVHTDVPACSLPPSLPPGHSARSRRRRLARPPAIAQRRCRPERLPFSPRGGARGGSPRRAPPHRHRRDGDAEGAEREAGGGGRSGAGEGVAR